MGDMEAMAVFVEEEITMAEEKTYQELFSELEKYERIGINMRLDGHPASPQQIVTAHMVRENTSYMRDYVLSEDGCVKELRFNQLS